MNRSALTILKKDQLHSKRETFTTPLVKYSTSDSHVRAKVFHFEYAASMRVFATSKAIVTFSQ